MIMIRARSRWLVAGVAAAMLAATTPAASAARDDGRLSWRDCGGQGVVAGMRCAAIEVPADWAEPRGRKITLEVARLPATEPARRIGTVLGISSGYGIQELSRSAADLAELRRRFDLVGFDTRVTHWIARMPEVCKQPGASLHDPRGEKDFAELAAGMKAAFEKCRQADPTGLFAHLDALSVARDTEAIRRALGGERASFMAGGMGGVAAAAYARLFPHRVRAMYVDGVNNQTEGWPAQRLRYLPVLQKMVTRFAGWCADTPACALHGEDAEAVWRRLVRDADRHPIPVTSSRYGEGELTGWLLTSTTIPPDPGPRNAAWLAFADAVDRARRGDGSGFADQALGAASFVAMPGAQVMSCGDDRAYGSYAQLEDYRRKARDLAPEYAGAEITLLGCAGWPLPVANPARPLPTGALPPVLGVGTTWVDQVATESFTRMIPGSVTVAYDGPGHVTYLSGRKCPIRYATAYLTDLELPRPGTVCPAE
ncbi:alpha/beta fold hydrolase [Nonomuraea rhodomycinica]|uniref:Alpha/beta fold hydrolase n=1 Tax=Nonomuraea rhodomycinica TaxID=1712872 RepID=A0A7Y6ISM0_9ACTN|nr:alpha/beta fold hydrolase [Nonomuraea rhodomycinica]NUW43617.1 alpha/beta fold hydrolase [Nonomuraea rhodomycinica]